MMRRVFFRLVESSGEGDSAPVVSKRRPLGLFTAAEQEAVQELVKAKLLITSAEQQKTAAASFAPATVELAHESLLFAWPKLAEWLKDARQVLFVRNRLSHDALKRRQILAESPSQSSCADAELLIGNRLSEAQLMYARGDFHSVRGGLGDAEAAFLAASGNLQAKREKEARRQRHLFVCGVGVVVLGLGFGLLQQRMRTQQVSAANERISQKAKEASDAKDRIHQQLVNSYVERGSQLFFTSETSREGILWLHRAQREDQEQRKEIRNPTLPDLLKSAMQSADATKAVLIGHGHRVNNAAFSPDGRRIVTASWDNTARVWDAESGRLLAELKGHGDRVNRATYSPDERRIVTRRIAPMGAASSPRAWTVRRGFGMQRKGGCWQSSTAIGPASGARRIAPMGAASSPRAMIRRRGCAMQRADGYWQSSRALERALLARHLAPMSAASSPPERTVRGRCGTCRCAHRPRNQGSLRWLLSGELRPLWPKSSARFPRAATNDKLA